MQYTFGRWMYQVDRILAKAIGCMSDDLMDVDYHALYTSGISPVVAAHWAIKENMV